jgi:hypothetical protein
MRHQPITRMIPFLFIFLIALSLSCNFNPPVSASVKQTADALSASLSETGTATASAKGIDENQAKVATAQAKATATVQAVNATQTARATENTQEQAAEATIAAPVLAELPYYNVDPNKGHVDWTPDPITLDVTGYQQFKVQASPGTAANFVFATDVTWNTQYGSSGCGFMFRSNGNQNKPSQYMVIISRFGGGHAVFTAVVNGELANIHDFFPKTNDKKFSADNDATNRVAIVARGNNIDIYTNLALIGQVDTTQPPTEFNPPAKPIIPADQKDKAKMDAYLAQLDEYNDIVKQFQTQYQTALTNSKKLKAIFTDGFLGVMALSESGHTICKFSNTWEWIIDQQ